ncbi:hypothetical protein NP493_248g01024 [Ridgeia piscesae]|uniref:G-protein coupled receptors family 1 profile domain-containing protein n=1 Tax=Ridgeia piscesae TaxID=27915 RepID=A0AAD9NYQ7_RIDPI|nr:hypothetical protein NP493_248g01024 [Ridgeia piscesae]
MDSPVSEYVNYSHDMISYNRSDAGVDELDIESIMADYYNNLSGSDRSSQHTRNLITYYLMGIGAMTVCVLGLLGNILSLIILTQKTMRSSTYSYLSSIAVCDSLVLIFTMVLLMKDLDYPVKDQQKWPWDRGLYPYLFPFVHPLAFTFQVTSIWLTLAFTIDRYIMICHPFHAEPFCNIGVARKVVFTIYIIGMLFNIPKFFEYETVIIPIPMRNETRLGCDLTSFGRDHVFRKLYHSWFYITFVCGIPFIFLAVLNVCLIHAVRLSRRRGKEINAMERKRNDTTIMLIGVVVIFFFCQTPALVSRVIWAFEKDTKVFKRLSLYTLNETGNFLIVLNSAINFVPYYFFGRRFRRQFWGIFCQCVIRSRDNLSHGYSLTILDTQRTSIGSMQVIKLNGITASHPSISSASRCRGNSSTSGTTCERSGSTPRAGSDLSVPVGQFLDVKARSSITDSTEVMNDTNGSERASLVKGGLAEVNGNCRKVSGGSSVPSSQEKPYELPGESANLL